MIIWLASYPKSGNTWVRSFIGSLLYTKDGNSDFANLYNISQYPLKSHFSNICKDLKDINEVKKYWELSQDIINLDKKIKIFKTHNALLNVGGNIFSNSKNTVGVIHIVRYPKMISQRLLKSGENLNRLNLYGFLASNRDFLLSDLISKIVL